MSSFVDTHTHLFCEEFDTDRAAAVERAVAAGVTRLCLPAINRASVPLCLLFWLCVMSSQVYVTL